MIWDEKMKFSELLMTGHILKYFLLKKKKDKINRYVTNSASSDCVP